MEIIGRDEEIKILQNLHSKKGSQFLAVYGRRRVGKTFLIRNVYKEEIVFECVGLKDANKKDQIENFWIKLQEKYRSPHLPPSNWLETFRHLGKNIDKIIAKKNRKKVIFLDEISWYDTARSGFITAFTDFWNSYCSQQDNIILVICGSAASWIIDKVINDTGGLHNRLTKTIRLMPFSLQESKKFLEFQKVRLTIKDITQVYMMVGGIPYYLNQVEPGRGIPQIMDDLFFGKNASLRYEFQNLYAALFKNHENHISIVKALATKNKGLTRKEIIRTTKFKTGGGLTDTLRELEECGFIKKTRDADKYKEDGLYRLMDEYTIFYYKFLQSKKTSFKGAALFNSQRFKTWTGFAFENLCFKHIEEIAKALGIQGVAFGVYSFVDKGTEESTGCQIDLIIDRADNVVNIIETKFHNQEFVVTKKIAENINQKVNSFVRKTKPKKAVFTTLITAGSAKKNEHYLSVITNEIGLQQFFQ